MSIEANSPDVSPDTNTMKQHSALILLINGIRRRIIAGLFVVLPFVITFWIVYWLYSTVENYVIRPLVDLIAYLIVYLTDGRINDIELPWFANAVVVVLAVATVALLLYFLGFFARSRVIKLFDALLLRVPVVMTIHRGVSKVFQALTGQQELSRFKRVVLVAFPHPGMRVPGFVTSSCRDAATQKTILCVYVPTTPIPSSGYMLMIPEEDVTDIDWDLEQAIQAVVSFGITAPPEIQYYPQSSNGQKQTQPEKPNGQELPERHEAETE